MKARPFSSFALGFFLSYTLIAAVGYAAESKKADEKPKTQTEINAEVLKAIKEGDPEQLVKELQKASDETKISSELAFAEERKLRELDAKATQADFDKYRLAFSHAQEAQKKENELREKIQRIMANRGKALKPFLEVKP